jgi:hypothetical protein
MERLRFVLLPIFLADKQRLVLLPTVERGGVDTPLLQPLPFARIVQVFATLHLHNPYFAVAATHKEVGCVRRDITVRFTYPVMHNDRPLVQARSVTDPATIP